MISPDVSVLLRFVVVPMIAATIAVLGVIGLHEGLAAGIMDSHAATSVAAGDWPW